MEKYFKKTVSGIRLAFSGRGQGDMRAGETRLRWAKELGLGDCPPVKPEQVHGALVAVVDGKSREPVPGADGLVAIRTEKPVSICVLGADCIPIILVEAANQVIGACHAGWKGTVAGVSGETVEKMVQIGAKRNRIRVFFGPSICGHCYTIDRTRAQTFGKNPIIGKAVSGRGGVFRADLILANRLILKAVGISVARMTAVGPCTSCAAVNYFSYRQRQTWPYGENAGIVGFI